MKIGWQVKTYQHFMWSLYFSISDKGAKSSKTLAKYLVWCLRTKLQVYHHAFGK